MKSKHIDWNLGLKCDHRVWPWPWPWPWIFKVKYRIYYISAKMVWLPRNEKQTYRLNSKASNVTIRFEHGHDLDFVISRSNIEFAISPTKMARLPRNDKQTHRLNSGPQMWPMGLTFTITLTFKIWRSNVTLTFDHTYDLNHGFSWSNVEIALSRNGRADWHCTKVAVIHDHDHDLLATKVRCMDPPDSDRGDFGCRRVVDSSSSDRGYGIGRHTRPTLLGFRINFGTGRDFAMILELLFDKLVFFRGWLNIWIILSGDFLQTEIS